MTTSATIFAVAFACSSLIEQPIPGVTVAHYCPPPVIEKPFKAVTPAAIKPHKVKRKHRRKRR